MTIKTSPKAFVDTIWSCHRQGAWLFLAAKQGPRWIDCPIRNDEQRDDNVRKFLKQHSARHWDLYFCPNAFASPKRKATEALNTPYGWCDIDEADPQSFIPSPGVVWQSSPGRHQGVWRFKKRLRPKRAERVSKYLAYKFGGDSNGWSVTKYLRIPGTYNHKRDGKPPKVALIRCDLTPIDPTLLLKLAPKIKTASHVVDGGDFDLNRDAKALLKKYRKQIRHSKARTMLHHRKAFAPDRSAQVFIIMKGLYEAGVPWSDIACMIWHSPYFRSKHGTNTCALEAEIQRAMNKFETGDEN